MDIYYNISGMIGDKFIARSNEDEPFLICTLASITDLGFPLVTDEYGKEWIIFGILVPYSQYLEDILKQMNNREQYLFLANLRNCFSILEKEIKKANDARKPVA